MWRAAIKQEQPFPCALEPALGATSGETQGYSVLGAELLYLLYLFIIFTTLPHSELYNGVCT